MSKVRYEAFLWGAGTALGELPPYFMARAARLSGRESTEDGDVTLEDIEDLKKRSAAGEKLGLFERGKLFMETLVERVGFMGILACASVSDLKIESPDQIPNRCLILRSQIRCSIWRESLVATSWCPSGRSLEQH